MSWVVKYVLQLVGVVALAFAFVICAAMADLVIPGVGHVLLVLGCAALAFIPLALTEGAMWGRFRKLLLHLPFLATALAFLSWWSDYPLPSPNAGGGAYFLRCLEVNVAAFAAGALSYLAFDAGRRYYRRKHPTQSVPQTLTAAV